MEKFAFQTFMKQSIIEKTIILADAFHLIIDDFRPDKNENRPYRMNFFSNGRFVGYIEGKACKYKKESLQIDMPFVLYTSIGKIAGIYNTHFEQFDYHIEKLVGLFNVVECNKEIPYQTASHVCFANLKKEIVKFSFKKCASNYFLETMKRSKTYEETVRIYFYDYFLQIQHRYYPQINKKIEFATIIMNAEKSGNLLVDFHFLEKEPYEKSFDIPPSPKSLHPTIREILENFNYANIYGEIEAFDPRLFTFLDEIRSEFTLHDEKNMPVNIYDRMAMLCFMAPKDKFFYDFTRAEEENNTIEQNPVLKRRNKYYQIKKN